MKLFENSRSHSLKENGGYRHFWYPFGHIHHTTIRNEFYPFKNDDTIGFMLELNADSESTINWSLHIPWVFSWHFTVDAGFGYKTWWRKLLRLDDGRKYDGREWGLRWYKNSESVDGPMIWLDLGQFENEHRSTDPKWLHFTFYPQRWIFGRTQYKKEFLDKVFIRAMVKGNKDYPDKEYDFIVEQERRTWTWPRFKKPLVVTDFEVTVEGGVPHQGKGTCDYNCGESGLISTGSKAETPELAVQDFIKQVNWYRKNYPL